MTSTRRSYLEVLASVIEDEIVVSCLGDSSRQWENLKPKRSNIYLRGAMSLAIPVGVGVALSMPDHQVVVLEGDGSLLMNIGCLVTVAELELPNLTILLFNNGVYESSGGQRLPGQHASYEALARAAGIPHCATFDTAEGFSTAVRSGLPREGPSFFCLKTAYRSGYKPAPLHLTPLEVRDNFLQWVREIRTQQIDE
ncbi:MAG: thiamine pyrophosphate-dependent enzyme [Anaerolineae bacterium]